MRREDQLCSIRIGLRTIEELDDVFGNQRKQRRAQRISSSFLSRPQLGSGADPPPPQFCGSSYPKVRLIYEIIVKKLRLFQKLAVYLSWIMCL